MTRTIFHPAIVAAALLALAGCAELGNKEKPQAVTPQITEDVLRARAQDSLAAGVKQYDTGDYENAEKSLQNSLDHGLLSKAD